MGKKLNLTVVLDGGMVETYVNGRFAITTLIWTTEAVTPSARTHGLVAVATAAAAPGAADVLGESKSSSWRDEDAQNEAVVLEAWELQTEGVLVPPTPYG